jgi:hypothetical protein
MVPPVAIVRLPRPGARVRTGCGSGGFTAGYPLCRPFRTFARGLLNDKEQSEALRSANLNWVLPGASGKSEPPVGALRSANLNWVLPGASGKSEPPVGAPPCA